MTEPYDAEATGAEGHELTLAFPLWGLGAALAIYGFLRGRPLLVLAGAAAFFADHRAKPVRRLLAVVGDEG